MIPTLTLVGNILAGLSTLAGLLSVCARLWAWRRHEADKAAHARRVRKATPAEYPELEHTRPDPPPQLGGLLVLAVGGALASLLLAAHHGGLLAGAAPVQRSCTSDGGCPRGQRCVSGTCTTIAHRPRPLVAQDELIDGIWWAGRDVPGWQDTEPETLPGRAPEVVQIGGYRYQR